MIFELQNGPISYDENRLSNLIYNPLTFHQAVRQIFILLAF